MSAKPRCYWDSDVFLALINEEPARVPSIRATLTEAEQGLRQIVTSTLTMTEVAFAASEKCARTLEANTLWEIDQLWTPGASPVKLADFHAGIARGARDLIRRGLDEGVRILKPADAVHLATAISLRADVFHTYNLDDYQHWATRFSITIDEPRPFQQPLPYEEP